MKHFRNLFITAFFIGHSLAHAQNDLVVNPINPVTNPLVDSLVKKMVGNGVQISNIRSNLKQTTRALATFRTNSPQLLSGIRSGLMMVTGVADTMAGNNSGGVISRSIPASDTVAGCSQGRQMLNLVLAGNSTASRRATDCVTIQFDFIPATDTIRFNYIFASEEYNQFVCSNFNDIFGFFIKGPGINGDANLAPTFLNTKNIAIIPGTNLPVSINTVNNGTPGSGPASDCDFTPQGIAAYIDNTTAGQTIPAIYNNLRFNGLTRKLQAVVRVIPCQTYTLTLTVSDVTDGVYDSGVFIEAGSLQASGIYAVQSGSLNGSNPEVTVGGNPAEFILGRCQNDTANRLIIPLYIDPVHSTAVNGIHVMQIDTLGDTVNISNQFVLRQGVASDTLSIIGIDNGWTDYVTPRKLVIQLLNILNPYLNGAPNFSGDSIVLKIKPVFFRKQPVNQEALVGTPVKFFVQTANSSIPRRWQVQPAGSSDFVDLDDGVGVFSGVFTDTLRLSSTLLDFDNFSFRCSFLPAGLPPFYSLPGLLNVIPQPFLILQQPSIQTVNLGGAALFTVKTSDPTVPRNWQRNSGIGGWADLTDGSIYSGTTTDSLVIQNALASLNNNLFRCRFSPPEYPEQFSNPATLFVPNQVLLKNSPLRIFPNPATGNSLQLSGRAQAFRLTNLLGQTEISRREINGEDSIDIRHLPDGVYFVTIEDAGRRWVSKLVVQR